MNYIDIVSDVYNSVLPTCIYPADDNFRYDAGDIQILNIQKEVIMDVYHECCISKISYPVSNETVSCIFLFLCVLRALYRFEWSVCRFGKSNGISLQRHMPFLETSVSCKEC